MSAEALRLSAEQLEEFGESIKKVLKDWVKKNGKTMTRYQLKAVNRDIIKEAGRPHDPRTEAALEKELIDGGILEAMGITLTKGMHASEELRFASEEEALQYLADVTGQKVVVAENTEEKP